MQAADQECDSKDLEGLTSTSKGRPSLCQRQQGCGPTRATEDAPVPQCRRPEQWRHYRRDIGVSAGLYAGH